jgi:hypothetical protein
MPTIIEFCGACASEHINDGKSFVASPVIRRNAHQNGSFLAENRRIYRVPAMHDARHLLILRENRQRKNAEIKTANRDFLIIKPP